MHEPLAVAAGTFAAGVNFSQLPLEAVQTAKMGLIDCVAVMVAGQSEAPVQILKNVLAAGNHLTESTLYFSKERLSAPDAAWINGTAGHVLDYDDFIRVQHPSVILVPAILAEGEAISASGEAMLTAYVAGYEVWLDLALREPDSHPVKGLHATPLMGAVAAAAACANLRGLDALAATSALGIAAAQASGITASYGTMAKSVQVGKAAYTGVISARLAAAGMTAAVDSLDGERGFLRAISPAGNVDVSHEPHFGRRWHILEHGLSIKRYPMCYCAHRSIDAVLGLMERHRIAPQQIRQLEVTMGKTHATILEHHAPKSALAAKFSAEFAVSAAILSGDVGLAQVNDHFVLRDDVQDLMRKVRIVTTENYDPEAPSFSVFDQVKVILQTGEYLESEQVRHALGNAKRPLNAKDLQKKFYDCLAYGDSQLDAGKLLSALSNFETLSDCKKLYVGRE